MQNMLGLKSVLTATKMIAGIEAIHMIKKDKLSRGRNLSKSRYILFMNSLV
nr:transposase [Bacillus toyonensis]